jgi:hypothetical protein
MTGKTLLKIAVLCALMSFQLGAQSTTDMAALKGLAPVIEYIRRQSGPRGELHGYGRYPNWPSARLNHLISGA